MFKIFGMEMHASHACNLHCAYCAHYSNYNVGGNVPVKDAEKWMQAWNKRLKPRRFSILGGEPLLNPEALQYLEIARKCWPHSKIHFVTNGFLLDRYPNLPKAIKDAAPSRLVVSRHHAGNEYTKAFRKIMDKVKNWEKKWGIEIEFEQGIKHWRRTYLGWAKTMKPFNEKNYKKSFAACKMKNNCRNLFNYKLYKCAPLAYLPLIAEKMQLGEEWEPYKIYPPLSPDCTDKQLKEWLQQTAIPECGMCPTRYEYINIPNPMHKTPPHLPLI